MRLPFAALLLALMAGQSIAAPQYSTVINLTENDDIAIIEDDDNPGDNIYQVRSDSGTFPTTSFALPWGELRINMLGGNDKVTFAAETFPELSALVFIHGGDGNDEAFVGGLRTSSSVIADDFLGDNSLRLENCQVAGDVAVYDGGGVQTVRILRSNVDGTVIVAGPDGGSVVEIGRDGATTRVGGSVLIDNTGWGDDRLTLFGSIGGDFYCNTGNGATNFSSFFSGIAGSLSVLVESGLIEMGTGEVTIGDSLFAYCGEGQTTKRIYNTAVGGIINFTSFLGYDDADLINVDAQELQISNGEGGSLLQLRDGFTGPPFRLNIGRVVSYSENGADEVELSTVGVKPSTPAFIGSMELVSGIGNSRFEADDNFTIGNLVHSNAGGFVILTLDGTIIQDNLISWNDVGGSDVLLRDAYVGGLTDIQSLDGSDYFRVYDSLFIGPAYFMTNNGTDTFTLSNSTFGSDFVADGGFDFDIFETTNDSVFGGIEYTPGWEFFFPLGGLE